MAEGTLGMVAQWLVIIGAVNWGLVGINASWNVVQALLGFSPIVVSIVYWLVGLSGLYLIYDMTQ